MSHPPILKEAEQRGLSTLTAQNFQSFPGQGIAGTVNHRDVAVGTAAFLETRGAATGPLAAQADSLRGQGETVVWVALDGKAAGLLAAADPIKSSTTEAVDILRRSGLRLAALAVAAT